MGTEQRYDIYDLFLAFPEPLVPRRLRLEVAERLDRDGAVVVPLDEAAVGRAVETLVADGVEALAICFLHAYRNPATSGAPARSCAGAGPGAARSRSRPRSSPELREYERMRDDLRQRLRAAPGRPLPRRGWSASWRARASAARSG